MLRGEGLVRVLLLDRGRCRGLRSHPCCWRGTSSRSSQSQEPCGKSLWNLRHRVIGTIGVKALATDYRSWVRVKSYKGSSMSCTQDGKPSSSRVYVTGLPVQLAVRVKAQARQMNPLWRTVAAPP